MFALLTLPRGLPREPEPGARRSGDDGEPPAGIVIRPGPVAPAVPLRALAAAWTAAAAAAR